MALYLANLLLIVRDALAAPVRRGSTRFEPVNNGQDAWAEAISGISPLILLIGERNTKQLIREIRGLPHILCLAFAPLGLISVLTSMIRLCGGHSLRSYLGYEQEARMHAALELTKVNCGGVHAHLVDGYLVRSTDPRPVGEVLLVTMVEGSSKHVLQEGVAQMVRCHQFRNDKARAGCPQAAGDVNWVLQVVSSFERLRDEVAMDILEDATCKALEIDADISAQRAIRSWLEGACESPAQGTLESITTEIEEPPSPNNGHEQRSDSVTSSHAPRLRVTFFSTFDGVSELSGIPGSSLMTSSAIAILSGMSVVTVQLVCLWRDGWWTVGWFMVFFGYLGIVSGVSAAAWLIYSSSQSTTLRVASPTNIANWMQGLVVASKGGDSMDTSGSRLWQTTSHMNGFETVWLKQPTQLRFFYAWIVTVFLTLSFVCHYLGLKTTRWWLSLAELAICLGAAFVRSTKKSVQRYYQPAQDVHLDRKCYSTGVLDVKRASRVGYEPAACLDLRMYSSRSTECLPVTGEHIAWQAANLCLSVNHLKNRIIALTGMDILILPSPAECRKVAVSFLGGVITEQDLCFFNRRMGLAFQCSTKDLASPTPLLARAIMRQPEWSVGTSGVKRDALMPFLGGLYISTLESLMTWWSVAEDRNDVGDHQKNLHGSFLLLNTAFFVALLSQMPMDAGLHDCIEQMHGNSSPDSRVAAQKFIDLLTEHLCPQELHMGSQV